jgi:CAAX prenyl protease-like protein
MPVRAEPINLRLKTTPMQYSARTPGWQSALPWVLPFALYLILTQIPLRFPVHYPWLYTLCVLTVGAVTVGLLRGKGLLRCHRQVLAGIVFGLAGIAVWIFLADLNLERHLFAFLPEGLQPQPRAAFNPFREITPLTGQWSFIAIRLLGIAVLVPLAEELFWRGFLLRWIIAPDWQAVAPGRYSLKSFLWVTLLFTLAHPEWLAAAVYCMLMNLLIYWKKDLWNCIIAHSVSNFCLVIYVLATGTWGLW